jgi:hypothetical protein
MSHSQLEELFQTFLYRSPTPFEVSTHGRKSYTDFKKEISNCLERKLLLESANRPKTSFKIGIIITGHIRKMSVIKNLQLRLTGYNYDIFVHTWDNIGIKGQETNIEDRTDINSIQNKLAEIPNLRKSTIENNKTYIKSLKNTVNYFNYSSPEPFIKSQLYSINQGFKLLEDYSLTNNIEYDVVLRMRFDTEMFLFDLKDSTVVDINTYPIIFVPNVDNAHSHPDHGTSCWACDNMYYKHGLKHVHVFEHTNVVCDLYAYGSYPSMKKYCELYDNYDTLLESYNQVNLKTYEKIPSSIKKVGKDYHLMGNKGHVESLYYYYCSYPERLLQLFLRDYMLVESKSIKLKLVR